MANPTQTDLERFHGIETDVIVLQKDSDLHTKILEKMEVNIDRAETHYEAINRIISTYDERLRHQDKINERFEKAVGDLQFKFESSIKEIEIKMDDHEQRKIRFLEDLKKDLIEKIDHVKLHNDDPNKNRIKVLSFFFDNWKFFAVIAAIILGITYNKWGFLISLLWS